MEKDRRTKVIAIVGLVVAVAALSLGFAAFTQNLVIKSSAKVNPSDTKLNVLFSSSGTAQKEDPVAADPSTGEAQTGTDATIVNTGTNPTISGLHADFTDKNQTVTYSFFVHNASDYVAYLRSVTFANATDSDSYKKCTAGTDTTESTVNSASGAACDDVSLKISVGGDEYNTTNAAISGKSINVDGYTPVIVTISYATETTTHPLPDGDFSVAFGDITLGYSSIDA